MNLEQCVKELSNKASVIKNQITNEEATKTSLILPFFKILGYDIENPQKVIPEYNVKSDRVDYSIMQNEMPLLFIEAKSVKENLSKHKEQIEKYFNNSKVKIICLTNGLDYEFYSDLNKDNVMDSEPFLIFNLENITTFEISYLEKLTKENFEIDNYNEIVYQIKATEFIRRQLENPSEEFIRFVADNVSKKKKTQKFLSRIKNVIISSVKDILTFISTGSIALPQTETINKPNPKIVTTPEEMEGYKIIISILSETLSIDNLNYKDTTSYFSIIADNKPKQWIARLCLGIKKKSIVLPGKDGGQVRHYINSVEDIYNFKDELIESASNYLASKMTVTVTVSDEAENITETTEVEITQPKRKRKIRDWLTH